MSRVLQGRVWPHLVILNHLLNKKRRRRLSRDLDGEIQLALRKLQRRFPHLRPGHYPRHDLDEEQKLRVAMLSSWPYPHRGGLSTYLRTLKRQLQRRGISTSVLSRTAFPSRKWRKSAVHMRVRIKKEMSKHYGNGHPQMFWSQTIMELYRRFLSPRFLRRWDVLHAHDLMTANLLINWRRRHRKPVIFTPHGLMSRRKIIAGGVDPDSVAGMYYRVLDHIAASCADHVIVLYRGFKPKVIACGASSQRISVVYSGVSRPAKLPAVRRLQARQPIVITYMGRMKASKGPHLLLKALRRLPHGGRKWQAIFVGDGRDLRSLIKKSRRYRLRGIRFLGYRSNTARILARSNILVVPGLQETMPLVVPEGMMAGQVIVASRVGGIPEIVRHRRSGILFPPGNVRALAAALKPLVSDRELRLRLAAAGQRYALQHLTASGMTKQILMIYKSVVTKQPPAEPQVNPAPPEPTGP